MGAISLLTAISPASALDFNFQFSDSGFTVTGSIFGLTDNATSTPTSVTVTSPDLGFADDVFIGTVSSFPREFTVASGVITDANFISRRDTSNDFLILDSDASLLGSSRVAELCVNNCNSGTTVAGDSIAASSATFTPLGATPVPFEVNPAMGLFLVGGIWGVNKLRKKRLVSNKDI